MQTAIDKKLKQLLALTEYKSQARLEAMLDEARLASQQPMMYWSDVLACQEFIKQLEVMVG